MHAIGNWLIETWKMNEAMAPWLLFGFAMSGLLHSFLPMGWIRKHLAREGMGSVVKAALIGTPLPFCSCGVIPISNWLRREGASKGATMSFLVSTPTTGLDSILATLAMMGTMFAIARPVVAIISGIAVGFIVSRISTNHVSHPVAVKDACCAGSCCDDDHEQNGELPSVIRVRATTMIGKLREAVEYGFVELVADLAKWLLLGLFVGGAISAFLPANFMESAGSLGRVGSYFVVILLGIPLYTCATGSIPIAAALVAKGVTPGAALVFLIVGPATNAATIAFVGGSFGKKILAVFLISVTAIGIAAGVTLDVFIPEFSFSHTAHHHGSDSLDWVSTIAAVVLAALIIPHAWRKVRTTFSHKAKQGASMVLHIPSISCGNCARHIDKAARSITGVESVLVDIATKRVEISGSFNQQALVAKLVEEGYPPAV